MDNDFLSQEIIDAVECESTDEYLYILDSAEDNGTSFSMDFDYPKRDGYLNEEQLFAIWEKEDVEKLIERLKMLL